MVKRDHVSPDVCFERELTEAANLYNACLVRESSESWDGLPMSYPTHSIAGGIEQRVYTKVLDERGGPALSRGPGSWLLVKQRKDGC
jgi:hypothetical protein